jgi:RHS repeat-associated protein
VLNDCGLGARGIDYIARTSSGATTAGFPFYDAHGSMTACLFRSGRTSYSLGDRRSYDSWGSVRQGAATGAPKARYCAWLGHKQDDESGLVYMRARYYEPGCGRFLSEVPKMSGPNWYSYCKNNPVRGSDTTGKDVDEDALQMLADLDAFAGLAGLVAIAVTGSVTANIVAWSGLVFLAAWFGMELTPFGQSLTISQRAGGFIVGSTFVASYGVRTALEEGPVGSIVDTCAAYAATIDVFCAMECLEQ